MLKVLGTKVGGDPDPNPLPFKNRIPAW